MVNTTSSSWAASVPSTRTPEATRVSAERARVVAGSVTPGSIRNEDVPALTKQLDEALAPHREAALFRSLSDPKPQERAAASERSALTASILRESRMANGGASNF
ncbi:hypothetical protein PDM28_14050 [Stenotrophomonas aracearum]|jgi:hypothetical protein|uniref:Uncharacterized protein n=1 Tax=Stenotrophomonas aracearum TaxID=3003272 RepID=A0ABY9YAS0_9GAMM|nr:hypothetical protein [Stenotrophomonas sp. A5588]WNH47793.1 hypothetical protein PDM28_14050 [Stenotrophomonas sp. A5588]